MPFKFDEMFDIKLSEKGQDTLQSKISDWTPDWLEGLLPSGKTQTKYVDKPMIDKNLYKIIGFGVAGLALLMLLTRKKTRRS